MKPDTVLKLGDFAFSGHEIPEKMPFGGDQRVVVQELIGGARVVDSMGRADAPLEWSGIMVGEGATERALYLDGLRIAGKPLTLSWHLFRYTVVVQNFHADFERFYKIPYRISCLVVEDQAAPMTTLVAAPIDAAIREDNDTAGGLGDLIGDGPLSSALSTLDTAIRGVSDFAKAAQSTINTVLAPIAAVQSRVSILISSVGNTVSNVATLGGILPGTSIAQQAAKLSGQVSAMNQLPALYNLQGVVGRMGANLGTICQGVKTITAAGGNLYAMAADAYGDATAWTTLAKANKLTDPKLSGVNTIAVPKTADGSGGVLA